MNKKIYYNDKYITFAGARTQKADNQSFDIYRQVNKQNVEAIAERLLDDNNKKNILITGQDFDEALEVLKDHFHYIEAAGGFIEKSDEFLFIHRHGRWDLPKGKLEKKETVEHAAIRECEEECGVRDLVIRYPLLSTFHVYAYKNTYALKQTFWFYMETAYEGTLLPQTEEDIHQVKWFNPEEIRTIVLKDTYYTISDVVTEALSL
jgi:8-oxo-dGTP pyrophosphatase MutT (NUDIX family)